MPRERTAELADFEIKEIKDYAAEKLGLCKKQHDIIGKHIFSILGLYARVIYYPLGENTVWGFTRLNGTQENQDPERPFVVINTSIAEDCQVFAAAHELYHIWYGKGSEIVPANIIDENCNDHDELKANRFAAEFLVDENLLRQEIDIYSIDCKNISIKHILTLSDLFSVPYRTMVKRLYEVGIFDKKKRESFLAYGNEEILKSRKLYSISEPERNDRIAIDNLIELAIDAYNQKRITYEKLEYLLGMSGLTPDEFGITEPICKVLPTDDELDAIMEE